MLLCLDLEIWADQNWVFQKIDLKSDDFRNSISIMQPKKMSTTFPKLGMEIYAIYASFFMIFRNGYDEHHLVAIEESTHTFELELFVPLE